MTRRSTRPGAPILLAALPLVLGLLWDGYLSDDAFVLLRQAQWLAAEGWASAPGSFPHPLPSEPLLLAVLTFGEWLALPSPPLAGLATVTGWSAAVAVLVRLRRRVSAPQPFLAGALLLALSPLVVGNNIPSSGWAVAVCLLLLAPSPERRQRRQGLPSVTLLLIVLDPATLLIAGLFLLRQWRRQRWLPWIPLILLLFIAVAWAGWRASFAGVGALWTPPDVAAWLTAVQGLLRESELYWLFLPALACGLLTMLSPALRPVSPGVCERMLLLLLAGAGGLLLGSRFAAALLAALGLMLVGLASAGLLAWLQREQRLAVPPRLASPGLALLVALPLLAAQITSLWQRYQFRPLAWQEMEKEAALWLEAQSEPDSTLWASQRAAYYARRPLMASDDAVLAAERLEEALAPVQEDEPQFVLSDDQLDWARVTRSSWFVIRYCPVYEDSSPGEPRSPLTVWQFQGETEQETAFGLRTAEGIELVDARVEPARIEPGDTVTLSLVWRALCPLSGPVEMRVRMITTLGEPVVEETFVAPQTTSFDAWQSGQIIEETYTITTGPEIGAGAYPIDLSLNTPDSVGPVWRLYRLQDARWIDRVTLGHVLRSWQGDRSDATPLAARFGEQIELEGARLDGEAIPGGALTLRLFWRALRQPDEHYTIFVHLLDEQDQFVAGADREPLQGLFPTGFWQAGERVGSEHPLQLPPDLSPGSYRVVAGLYLRQSGERLPVVDAQGEPLADGVFPLPFVIEAP